MKNLIARNTPRIAERFELKTIEKQGNKNIYSFETREGKILLSGDSKISLAMAYYRYLREFCDINLSWCGNTEINLNIAPLPDKKITHTFTQDKRAYLSHQTFGYSTCWWDWERWEREIDFMAMNGINMPLSIVGTEAVWYYALLDMGIDQTKVLEFLCAPMYWPWQLMTYMDGYMPLVDPLFVKTRMELGQKIINREVELGMTPIQQGFCGHIPAVIKGLAKRANIASAKPWCNFPSTFHLDPLDPLFNQISRALLEKQKELFGTHHYYSCDLFNNAKPFEKGDEYLKAVGSNVFELYNDFDENSVIVMSADSVREPLAKSVPQKRLLIIDKDSQSFEETNGFWGHDFIIGNIHNYGGRTVLHGSIDEIAENNYLSVKEKYSNNCGTGLFMEGLNQNPLYYDLAFEMLTSDGKIGLDEWLEKYAKRRYKSNEDCLKKAMSLLKESCYGKKNTGRETGSIVCARPSTEVRHTAPFDVFELRYDNKKLFECVSLLLESKNANSKGYVFDVCDILRQAMSNLAKEYYIKTMDGFNNKNVAVFENGCNSFLEIIEDIDRLVSTIPEMTLGHHLQAACDWARLDADKQNFEMNLLLQTTLWGPAADSQLYDCAWREWGDLIKSFYLKRWRAFFEYLASVFNKRNVTSTATKNQIFDRDLYLGNTQYKKLAKFERNWLSHYHPCESSNEDTLEVCRQLLEKHGNN